MGSQERALYCFECIFHTLFNMAHGNCRLDYKQAENRYRVIQAVEMSKILMV